MKPRAHYFVCCFKSFICSKCFGRFNTGFNTGWLGFIFFFLFIIPYRSDAALMKQTGKTQSNGAARQKWEIKDTHEKLNHIYQQLGIQQEESSMPTSGCRWQGKPETAKSSFKIAISPVPRSLSYALIIIILAMMLIPLYYVLRNNRSLTALRSLSEDSVSGVLDDQQQSYPLYPWPLNFAECRHLLSEGRVAEAFAGLHHLMLGYLSQRQLITLKRSTTNWEYVRQLSSQPALMSILTGVTQAAEQAVLGKRPLAHDLYVILEQQVMSAVAGGG